MKASVRIRQPLLYFVYLVFLFLLVLANSTVSCLLPHHDRPLHQGMHQGMHCPQQSRWNSNNVIGERIISRLSHSHTSDRDDSARPVQPQNISLHILYEDNDILAINKPAGVAVQYAAGSVENAVAFFLNSTSNTSCSYGTFGTSSWPWKSPRSFEGIVHRLDKGTSGILLLAKHPPAARTLKLAFEERRVHKTYLAIAEGFPTRTITKPAARSTIHSFPEVPEEEPLPHQKQLSKDIKNCGKNHTQALYLLEQARDPSASCYSAAISVCRRAGERDVAISLLESMLAPSSPVQPNLLSFKTVLSLCAMDPPRCDTALDLVLHKLPHCGFANHQRHPHCVSSAIAACGRGNRLDDALHLLELIETQEGGLVPACRQAAIKACERCGAWDQVHQLLQDLSEDDKDHRQSLPNKHDTAEVVLGVPFTVDAPIGKIGPRRMGVTTSSNGRGARSIVTPLAFQNGTSYHRIVIETGRTHQIRVHMADVLGCPLVGDTVYATDRDRKKSGQHRPMLHAAQLVVPHPTTGISLCLECPPPTDFEALGVQMMGTKDYYQTHFGLRECNPI